MSDKPVSEKEQKIERELPMLCKECPNSVFFKEKDNCSMFWEGKKECVSRIWLEKYM
jgi:hypothetical protein